jgi:hypothetical protein
VLPIEALRELAVRWLAANRGWLLVLDNVTDPADVAPLIARVPEGRYLITSRRATGWHDIAAIPVRLDVLYQPEAEELLTRILTHDQPWDADGAVQLCQEPGYLPLAVSQAAAFIVETGRTPRGYLRLLEDYPAQTYQSAPEGTSAERTIARIWHITLDRLAWDLLRVLAWYAPEGIPRNLLDGLGEPPDLIRSTGQLAAYSMITLDPPTIGMHRLVQAVARTPPNRATRTAAQRTSPGPGRAPLLGLRWQLPIGTTRRPGRPGGCCSPWPAMPIRPPIPSRSLPSFTARRRSASARARSPWPYGASAVPWPTGCGCWGRIIPTRWVRGTISPMSTSRLGI